MISDPVNSGATADDTQAINDFLNETTRVLQRLDRAAISRAKQILLDCYRRKGRVYTVGNGGSASTAQHFACDLANMSFQMASGHSMSAA